MSNRICKRCKSAKVVEDGCYGGTTYYRCDTCHHLGEKDEFPEATLFDHIKQSPEVMAEKLVYVIKQLFTISGTSRENPGGYEVKTKWFSTIVDGDFDSETEAIAATVAKLKEVAE